MIVIAGAFVTFLGFLAAGLLALVFTTLLDKSMGKEKALLLFTVLLLLFSLWQCTPGEIKARGKPKSEGVVTTEKLDIKGDPEARPPLERTDDFRNPFQKHSDTFSLSPVTLKLPPWLPLPFGMPPTVPGPAPVARRVLRGEMPSLVQGDGSTIEAIPPPVFADYRPVADDVYDWIYSTGRKTYVYIRALKRKKDGRAYEEADPGFLDLLHHLVTKGQGWESMKVEYAIVGNEDVASRKLERVDVLKARLAGRSWADATQFDRWYLRRSAENLYRETLRSNGLGTDPSKSTDISSLRNAAKQMAEVGRTGKEQREGWRRAAMLLDLALNQARARAAPAVRAEILEDLVEAYVELRDEKAVLRALSEYARTSPNRPEPWLWLGRMHLKSLGVPEEALAYFEMALQRSPRNPDALLGKGDALSALGRNEDALETYRKAGIGPEAKVRVAETYLRLGRLGQAAASLAGVMSGEGESPRALLAHGAVLYAQGDLEKAKEAFSRAALSTGEGALEFRAQACYDLGLTAWRLGQAHAAFAAFDACDQALQFGASPRRYDDETVSPAFGRALIALASANAAGLRTHFQEAREEAPRVAYHEMLAGQIAAGLGDHATAVRAFDRALALALVYPELDGWMARTRLELGHGARRAGTPLNEVANDFEAAVAFASRASESERLADKKAFDAMLREAWIRLSAEHVQLRQRLDSAREVVRRILKKIDPEQPGARAILGYCDYRLAEFGPSAVGPDVEDPYAPCIRDFQQVLNKVPPDDEGPWRSWRDYAALALRTVKHWLSLEEKIVVFEGDEVPSEWELDEPGGIRADIVDGTLRLGGSASSDGSLIEPTFVLKSSELFQVGTLEEIRLRVKIPTRDQGGSSMNPITFGVQVQRASKQSSSRSRYSGIGVFFDRGKVALRIGGGQLERWKDGDVHRIVPETDWPSDGWLEVRIARIDAKEGRMQIWLDPDPGDDDPGIPLIPPDEDGKEGEPVSGFKGTARSKSELWIGGYSNQAQEWNVEFRGIRVIRRK